MAVVDDKRKSVLAVEQPLGRENPWEIAVSESRSDEASQSARPAEPAESEASVRSDERPSPATGVEDVRAGVPASTPQTWQEAVADNFTAKPSQRKVGSVDDVIDELMARRAAVNLPSKEMLEKMRRRQRARGIVSAISDGARAVSNLIGTTQYAPDMYNGETMSDKWRERRDKLKARYDADADRYLNYSLMINKLREGQEAKEYQRGRDALQDQIATIRTQYNAKLADIKYRRATQQLDDAKAAAEERDATRELDRRIKEARLDVLESQKRKNDRWRPSTGGGGGSRGSGTTGLYTLRRVNPQTGEVEYKTGFKSEAAAINYAMTYDDEGWNYVTNPAAKETVTTTEGVGPYGEPKTTTRKTKTSTNKSTNNKPATVAKKSIGW